MISVLVLDVPENRPVVEVAARNEIVNVDRIGPYFRVSAPSAFSIDRRSTGCRHAVWYSSVAGLIGARIVQWDKDAMRLEER